MGNATKNNHNFKMPCIYLPGMHTVDDENNAAPNKIGDLCDNIVKCADMKAQNNMSRLSKDSEILLKYIDDLEKINAEKQSAKGFREQISKTLWIIVVSMVCFSFLWVLVTFQSIVPDMVTETSLYQEIVAAVQPYISGNPDESSSLSRIISFCKFMGAFMTITFMARFVGSRAKEYPTLTDTEITRLDYIKKWVKRAGTDECDKMWKKFTDDVDGERD
jgi:hypothetical protein